MLDNGIFPQTVTDRSSVPFALREFIGSYLWSFDNDLSGNQHIFAVFANFTSDKMD
jgi:hypothetical protein